MSPGHESPAAPDTNWSLRRSAAADAEAIAAIFASSRREAMPYLPLLYTELEILEWIKDVVLRNRFVMLAVDRGGNIGGFAAVQRAVLEHLYVAPHLQGEGLGALLLAAAKKESASGLRLHVFQRNPSARQFYEKRGFRLIELRDGSSNEEGEPDAVYEWIGRGFRV